MPTSFKRFAVDFDGDGRRDVVDSVPDLIASTANNLKKDGWVAGQTWGYEVVRAEGLQFPARRSLAHDDDAGMGTRSASAAPAASRSRAPRTAPTCWCRPGAQGPGFLMLQNFRAIMKYNPAEAYALAIGHLADRLRGGEPFVQAWPRHERVLTRAERYELQQLLAQRGFDVGEPDGRLGRQDPQRAAPVPVERSARCPTASPPRRRWSGCAAGKTVWGWAGASIGGLRPSSS